MVNIDDDAERAYRESMEVLERYYGAGNVILEKVSYWLAHGPPEVVVEKIAQFLEAGCTTPVLRFTSFDPLGQLERCIDEVMPALRGKAKVAAAG